MSAGSKDKSNKMKQFLEEKFQTEDNNNKSKNKNFSVKKKSPLHVIHKLLSSDFGNIKKQMEDTQIMNCNIGDNGNKDEVISVFVRTSQRLQDMVRGYEAKINQTTAHMACLQHHVYNLHEQLENKNKTIGRLCDRYIATCKEKKAMEERMQKQIDELNSVVEASVKNDTPQLQRLLIQQISKNRYLEHQNSFISAHQRAESFSSSVAK